MESCAYCLHHNDRFKANFIEIKKKHFRSSLRDVSFVQIYIFQGLGRDGSVASALYEREVSHAPPRGARQSYRPNIEVGTYICNQHWIRFEGLFIKVRQTARTGSTGVFFFAF